MPTAFTSGRCSRNFLIFGACFSIKSFSGSNAPSCPYLSIFTLLLVTMSAMLPEAIIKLNASFLSVTVLAMVPFKDTLVRLAASVNTGHVSSKAPKLCMWMERETGALLAKLFCAPCPVDAVLGARLEFDGVGSFPPLQPANMQLAMVKIKAPVKACFNFCLFLINSVNLPNSM
ncbi:hypothetical protein D3C73_764580 [compost metagenome]